ncbi:DUF6895 family protein [Streptomyces sp. RPT161]|uniref:DUF6895 family protein n=1 Tax=Streptomyces sp. RPT161 TaxID=3015993 RepID=UPI0022B93959|nr:hypothetical protein [Streptomyces sp. RPT161]
MTAHPGLLHQVGSRSLSWLYQHLQFFRLPTDVVGAADHHTTLKPLGELARIALSVRRASPPGSPSYDFASGLLDFAWRECREGQVLFDVLRAHPMVTHPLEIYAVFAQGGLRHPEFEALARTLSATRAWTALELEPTRVLAVHEAQRVLGIAPRPDVVESAMGRTWLGGRPEPWAFEVRSGYALTHYVFHVTGWGEAPGRLPGDVSAYLDRWLPAWLDCCLEEEQWDLAGELLAVAASLPQAPTLEEAWQALALAQEPSGALPEVGDASAMAGDYFRLRYHSTLVAAFAASLAVARLATHTTAVPANSGSTV